MKLSTFTTTLLVFQLVLCSSAFAQNANSILKKMSDLHQKMMEEVDDMTLTMRPDGNIGGFDRITSYYKKEIVDGEPTFKTYSKFEGGLGEMMNASGASSQSMDLFALGANMYESLKDVATYEGNETIDGVKTNVLYVSDMTPQVQEALGGLQGGSMPGAEQDMQIEDVRIYVDEKKHVVRKMSMSTKVAQEGRNVDMNMSITMSDYRKVGPMDYPFAIKTVMENPMSPEQRAEIAQQREQIEAMLENLPEGQRGPVKNMLEALGQDQIEISMIVEDLKVNEGVPAEYFE